MIESDAPAFEKILVTLFRSMHRDPPGRDIVRVWWDACMDIELDRFSKACSAYVRTDVMPPTVSAIRNLAGANKSAWPTPEEAWNQVPKSELDSAWVFPEMLAALSAAQDSLDAGDRIGARKAFLQVYEREVQGKEGEPGWFISAGICPVDQREQQRLELMESRPERLTKGGKKALENLQRLRDQAISKGMHLLTSDEVLEEVKRRRGEGDE